MLGSPLAENFPPCLFFWSSWLPPRLALALALVSPKLLALPYPSSSTAATGVNYVD